MESGRFWGVWKPRLIRALMVRLTGLSLQSRTGTPSRTTHPPESPALLVLADKRINNIRVNHTLEDAGLTLKVRPYVRSAWPFHEIVRTNLTFPEWGSSLRRKSCEMAKRRKEEHGGDPNATGKRLIRAA